MNVNQNKFVILFSRYKVLKALIVSCSENPKLFIENLEFLRKTKFRYFDISNQIYSNFQAKLVWFHIEAFLQKLNIFGYFLIFFFLKLSHLINLSSGRCI
jgi:hypothetical protein